MSETVHETFAQRLLRAAQQAGGGARAQAGSSRASGVAFGAPVAPQTRPTAEGGTRRLFIFDVDPFDDTGTFFGEEPLLED